MSFVRVAPEDADLSAASIKRFLKLAADERLLVRVHVTRSRVAATYYESKSKHHNVGDLKKPEHEIECVFITVTDLETFAADGVWYDGKFEHAHIGGPKSGYRPARMFKQITTTMQEISRCLA